MHSLEMIIALNDRQAQREREDRENDRARYEKKSQVSYPDFDAASADLQRRVDLGEFEEEPAGDEVEEDFNGGSFGYPWDDAEDDYYDDYPEYYGADTYDSDLWNEY